MNSKFMSEALLEAKMAAESGEVPVGAVVVKNGEIIGRGRNRCEDKNMQTRHAEIEAIEAAAKNIGDWRLDGCEIYVTLEPCPMCAGAIINSRIKTVVFGVYDSVSGAADSVINLFSLPFPSSPEVFGGIREAECKKLLTEFFKKRREK